MAAFTPDTTPSLGGCDAGWSSQLKPTLLHTLQTLDINYHIKPYDPELNLDHDSDGTYCKNLLLKDRKGCFYYVIIPTQHKLDLKRFKSTVGAHRNVNFACEADVWRLVQCKPGALTPFGAMFTNHDSNLRIIIDKILVESSSRLYFHPFVADEALSLTFCDLVKFIEHHNHTIEICEF